MFSLSGKFIIIEIVIVIYPRLYVIGSIKYRPDILCGQREYKDNGVRELPVLLFV